MHFQAAALFATAVALTQAMPTLNSLTKRGVSDCDSSNFTGATSDGSPLVSDCQQMIANIQSDSTWDVNNWTGQRTLTTYGTCAFGGNYEGNGIGGAAFGNQDIIDLVTDSINQFQSNGLVGASGYLNCDSGSGSMPMSWGLYHT